MAILFPLSALPHAVARSGAPGASRLGVGHRLLGGQVPSPGSSRGFTLLELLVVVVIIAILAGLSAGAVIRYGNKARVSAAKAVVASAARECLRWMLDSEGASFALGTSAGEGFRLSPDPPECGGPQVIPFNITIDAMPGSTFGVNVKPDGTLERVCTGPVDCAGGRW